MTRPVSLTDLASAARIAARVAVVGAHRPYPDARKRIAAQDAARYAVRRAQETRAAVRREKARTRPRKPATARQEAAQ